MLLRKGVGMTLENGIEINRTEEVKRRQIQLLKNGIDVDIINKRPQKQPSNTIKSAARMCRDDKSVTKNLQQHKKCSYSAQTERVPSL